MEDMKPEQEGVKLGNVGGREQGVEGKELC